MLHTATVASGAQAYVCEIIVEDGKTAWYASALTSGNFGGGALTLGFSLDNGVTLIPVSTRSGTVFSQSANGSAGIGPEGHTARNNVILKLYASLTGTGGSVLVQVCDNRG